ncbi:hypothetical protein J6590_053696 [Homalodisca vitripennis]|nr:hypothetical protein J6590_053696 [Homalodisca vitripennis]
MIQINCELISCGYSQVISSVTHACFPIYLWTIHGRRQTVSAATTGCERARANFLPKRGNENEGNWTGLRRSLDRSQQSSKCLALCVCIHCRKCVFPAPIHLRNTDDFNGSLGRLIDSGIAFLP